MSQMYYEKYRDRYKRGGCTIEQLKKLVSLKILTKEEYEKIIEK